MKQETKYTYQRSSNGAWHTSRQQYDTEQEAREQMSQAKYADFFTPYRLVKVYASGAVRVIRA